MNFVKGYFEHNVEDRELDPLTFAEQYADPDPSKALPSEELLHRARMIFATELGKDPILRDEIRKVFRDRALVSILPTDRGLNKITDHDPFYVSGSATAPSRIVTQICYIYRILNISTTSAFRT